MMSTSIYNPPTSPRKTSTPFRHRRSTISLHSTPGLGLIRTISRDLVTGWHTTTALQNEPCPPRSSGVAPTQPYVPRYAARDAIKSFTPAGFCDAEATDGSNGGQKERKRQDSVVPEVEGIDGTKPLKACVEEGLVPDHRDDTWSAVWETAYEERRSAYHLPSSSSTSTTATSPASISPSANSTLSTTKTTRPKVSRPSRPPLTGRLSVTDAEIKAFIFGHSEENRKRSHESPEAFLRHRGERRGSEVPSLVSSLVYNEGSCCESRLEVLVEGDVEQEQEEEQGAGHVREAKDGRDGIEGMRAGGDVRSVWWEVKAEKKAGRVGVVPAALDAEIV
jgi:hypothetical protein